MAIAESVAAEVRRKVDQAQIRSFVTSAELAGSRPAVETALSRLVSQGDLLRVRHGLYWKGPKTRAGMPRPRPAEVALQVAGAGSGPAGVSAARALGLTTQVPAVEEIAIAGRTPKPVQGVVFTSRPITRRLLGLVPLEVALLETMRTWPTYSEVSYERLAESVHRFLHSGAIRPDRIEQALRAERSPHARELWHHLTSTSA